MLFVLIIAVIAAAVYAYAAIAYYYNFKHWNPFCNCGSGACSLKDAPQKDRPAAPAA